ncbi:hypothetical protein SANT12839_084050 [Streptomyces antimycoticus]|uniref:Uncharacterized protein n=1 Tax=Streptomyces antimycoticus TaxID=68175 RepID=A0A4D4KNS0_9ACTN|nr:hypothetical protein SANT12839_084050 [Streptomyces antimycoticus]
MRFRSSFARSVVATVALALGALGLLTGPGPAAADTPSDGSPVVQGLRGDYYLQSARGPSTSMS